MKQKLFQGARFAKEIKANGASDRIRSMFAMHPDPRTKLMVYDPASERSWDEFKGIIDECFQERVTAWEWIREQCQGDSTAAIEIARAWKHVMRDELTKKVIQAENYNLNRENLVAIISNLGLTGGHQIDNWSIRKLRKLLPTEMQDKAEDLLCPICSVAMKIPAAGKSRGTRNVSQFCLSLHVRRWTPVAAPGHLHLKRTLKVGTDRQLEKMRQRIAEYNDPRNELMAGVSSGNVDDAKESEIARMIDRLLSRKILSGRKVKRIGRDAH
jgi:hypothetical protein